MVLTLRGRLCLRDAGEAGAVVGDADRYDAVARLSRNPHTPNGRIAEFNGVGNQIDQDLNQPVTVGDDTR